MSIVRSIGNVPSFANSIPGKPVLATNARRVIESQNWCGENRPGNVHFNFSPDGAYVDYVTDIFVTNGVPVRFAVLAQAVAGVTVTFECLDSEGSVHEIEIAVNAPASWFPVYEDYDRLPPGWVRVRISVVRGDGDSFPIVYYCADTKQTAFFPPGPLSVFSDFEWGLEYHAADVSGSSWPAYLGRGATLAAAGSNASVDVQNLHDFRHLGMFKRQWNKSAIANTAGGTHGYRVASGQAWPVDSDGAFHIRFVLRPVLTAAATRLWLYFGTSVGPRFVEFGSVNGTQFRIRWASNGTQTVSVGTTTNKPLLIDADFHPTAGTGGNGRIRVYVNGELEATSNHTAPQNVAFSTHQLNLLGGISGGNSSVSALVGFAARGGLITLAQHEYAAQRLGLSGGA